MFTSHFGLKFPKQVERNGTIKSVITMTDKNTACAAERFPSKEMSSDSDDDSICQVSSSTGDKSIHEFLASNDPGQTESIGHVDHQSKSRDTLERRSPNSCLMAFVDEEYIQYELRRKLHAAAVNRNSYSFPRKTNTVALHIYDLIAKDTLMQLPWGCVCEIGKCFNEVNSALHQLGTGAYHVGVECNGIEYAFGACSQPHKSGVFSCIPKLSPGYQYRTSIEFGCVELMRSTWVVVPSGDHQSMTRSTTTTSFRQVDQFVEGRTIMKELAAEYMGIDYDILRRNCCTFAAEACVRLGVPQEQIPSWFRNLADTGAYSQDVANAAFVEPIQKVFLTAANEDTMCGADYDSEEPCVSHDDEETGFEVISKRNASDTRNVVVVVDADPNQRQIGRFRSRASMAY